MEEEEFVPELRKFFDDIRTKRERDMIKPDEFTQTQFAARTGHSYEATKLILEKMVADGQATVREEIIKDGKRSRLYKLAKK